MPGGAGGGPIEPLLLSAISAAFNDTRAGSKACTPEVLRVLVINAEWYVTLQYQRGQWVTCKTLSKEQGLYGGRLES